MSLIAVITGDLINSTRVSEPDEFRNHLLDLMKLLSEDYGAITNVYRGDGFQVAIDADRYNAFEIAILIRAGLIGHATNKSDRWDARAAIAFAAGQKLSDQNNEAYIGSGRTLDAMVESHLEVYAHDRFESLAFGAATAFADEIINNLTQVEAEVLYLLLRFRESHQNIADRLGKKRPTVTLALQRAHYQLLDRYIADMNELVIQLHGSDN